MTRERATATEPMEPIRPIVRRVIVAIAEKHPAFRKQPAVNELLASNG